MAAAKPILSIMNGEGGEVVKAADCGWSLKAGDAQSLAETVIRLSQSEKHILEEKGKNGLAYYLENFEKSKSLKKLDKLMRLD